jgi:putative flippase GtrA/phosphoserine phosphatase
MKYNVYDFDGTIYDGDSGVDFVKYSIRKKPKTLLYLLGTIGTVILFLFKRRTKEDIKTKLFGFVKEIDDLDGFVADFWKKHEKKLKKFWTEKEDHKNDIISSASCRFWLEPIAKKYKVAHLFATEIDLTTGEIIGNNCHGTEKVRLFYIEYPKGSINEMYTDSTSDLPMIKEAKQGYMVKKNKIMKYEDYKPCLFKRFWNWGWGVYHKNEELWNYLIVGGLTTVVSIVSYFIARIFLDSVSICTVISWICAVSFAYITNRIIVFKSKSKKVVTELFSFVGSRLFSLLVELGFMLLMANVMHINDRIAKIIVQFIVLVLNYITSKLIVFRKK